MSGAFGNDRNVEIGEWSLQILPFDCPTSGISVGQILTYRWSDSSRVVPNSWCAVLEDPELHLSAQGPMPPCFVVSRTPDFEHCSCALNPRQKPPSVDSPPHSTLACEHAAHAAVLCLRARHNAICTATSHPFPHPHPSVTSPHSREHQLTNRNPFQPAPSNGPHHCPTSFAIQVPQHVPKQSVAVEV